MTTTTGVSKLKELLFDQESATIAELERRIGLVAEAERLGRSELAQRIAQAEAAAAARLADAQSAAGVRVAEQVAEARAAAAAEAARLAAAAAERLASLEAEHQRARADLLARIEELNRRTGTPNALRASVAEVIDDVIVDARGARHDQMARAVAPLVVKTIKTELRNSQDEMVEALYPITGRLVKAYVASAMKDMMNQMNRRLEMNPLMLRFRSLLSGYSMAELVLADTQRLEMEELFLIQRGSGALIQRWPESASASRSNADIHMSGVITAINDFAGHAFQDAGGTLRSLSMDDGSTVFLRASPVHLLAVKCRGVPVSGVEQMLDEELLAIVSTLHDQAGGMHVPGDVLAMLRQRLETGIEEKHARLARAGLPFNPLKALAMTTALLLVVGGGLYGWTIYEREQARAAAQEVVDRSPAFKGFPVQIEAGWRGQSLALSGIAPSPADKDTLIDGLRQALPAASIKDGLAVLPGTPPDPEPRIAAVRRDVSALEKEISQRGIKRSLDRAAGRLLQSLPELERLVEQRAGAKRAVAERARASVIEVVGGLDAQRRAVEAAGAAPASAAFQTELLRLTGELQRTAAALAASVGEGGAVQRDPPARPAAQSRDPAEAAEEVALAAERVATIAAAAAHAGSIRIPEPVALTPLERLQAFVRTQAIFFGNGDDYRAPEKAEAVMDDVVRLMKDTNVALRVVGYTDERGGAPRNAPLSQQRADKVLQGLIARGAVRERLTAIGRPGGPDLSTNVGPSSPNRRVEFEIGFDGEMAGGQ